MAEPDIADKGAKAEIDPTELPKPAQPGAEVGGRTGPEPTRYGDWEKNGRCIDF